MTGATAGPPRPTATLRIGLCGVAGDQAAACVAEIARAAAEAVGAAPWAFAPGPPVLRSVRVLPDEEAGAVAGRRHAAIATRRLDHPSADTVMELGEAATDGDDPAAGRAMADRILVGHSDLLVLGTDDRRARHLASEARSAGIPVVRLPEAGGTPWVIEGDGTTETGTLAAVVGRLLAPPSGPGLRRFYAEPWRTGSGWVAYEWLGLLAGRRPARWLRVDYVAPDAADRERFLAPVAGRIGRLEHELRAVLHARFLWADNLALHLGHVYRSAYVLGFGLAALAVLVGVVAAEVEGTARIALLAVELAIISGITALTRVGRRRRWHRRWLDCRRLAELLRPARLRALTGQARLPGPDGGGDSAGAWVDWYARATLRELSLPHAAIDRELLEAIVRAALDGELGDPDHGTGEIGYHDRNRRRLSALDRRLDLVGTLSFGLTAAVAAGLLVLTAGERLRPGLGAALAGWEPLATLLIAGFPAVGAALAGIRAQGEFRFLAERSSATRAALAGIRARLLRTAGAPTLETVDRDLAAATEAMGGDVDGWRLVYRARDLTLPG